MFLKHCFSVFLLCHGTFRNRPSSCRKQLASLQMYQNLVSSCLKSAADWLDVGWFSGFKEEFTLAASSWTDVTAMGG